ncbi:hypothetical protein ABWH91_13710 [Phycisphaerales bacterium ac7]
MGQTPPGLNENTQRRGSRLWLLVLGLALVLSVYTAISTVQQRQRLNAMVDQLGDSSAAARSQAIGYLFDGDMTEAGRLSDSPRAQRRLEDASVGFSDAALAQLFDEVIKPREAEWFTLSYHAPLTFYRSIIAAVRMDPLDTEQRREAITKLDLALQTGQRDAGYGLVWDVAEQTERDLILETFRAIADSASNDPDATGDTTGLFTALSLIGDEALPIVEPLLDARSADVQRASWLVLGVLDIGTGYTARWREASQPVAEAMIASSVILSTDPDIATARFRDEIASDSPLRAALDALAELPRDAQGRIDLSADPPQTTPAPGLLSDLYAVRERVRFASFRVESFRDRDSGDGV